MSAVRAILVTGMLVGTLIFARQAAAQETDEQIIVKLATDMEFVDVAPGISKSVLWGDPQRSAYGALTRFKAATWNQNHMHSSRLKIIVISGAYVYSTGTNQVHVGPGHVAEIPARTKHSSGSLEDTLFVEIGDGPFDLHFVASESTDADNPIIGHLERSDAVVTLIAGADGPRYTIRSKDGSVVANQISEHELQAFYPEMHRDIKTGLAGNDARIFD